ncbi:PREDICTED: protein cereblon-like isoform X2 [Priapulus caudatus]|uniref:Protein cereblon n=1 Tax=Priapulus caudatus TaxID=37621 RepID=A0ABM1EWL9_PRICU|nr:PREDICTED: protein cereblon-like isoform X2 [Priapulus caudatus]
MAGDDMRMMLLNDEDPSDSERTDEDEEAVAPPGDVAAATKSDPPTIINITYDMNLPMTHSYLGDDLEEVSGRAILEEDTCVNVLLMSMPDVILVPGQILPLKLFQHRLVSLMKHIIMQRDKIFGMVAYSAAMPVHASVGTLAEVYSYKEDADTLFETLCVKAMGRQRFRIQETWRQADGNILAKVRILPEITLPDFLEGARPDSWRKFNIAPLRAGSKARMSWSEGDGFYLQLKSTYRKYDRLASAILTSWPRWVYKQYDTNHLVAAIKKELRSWNEMINVDNLPIDPAMLSYWVTANLPLEDATRLEMLTINSAVQRLRALLAILLKCSVLRCSECRADIAGKRDVFSMSLGGPMAAYVNPGGHVHEMITVIAARNLHLVGGPSTENSWFPGYAWTILNCRGCHQHMGWKFTDVSGDRRLEPHQFWGLCRGSLVPGLSRPGNADNDDADDNDGVVYVM